MHNDTLIIQFAKFPRIGNVKTRLQPLLGKGGCYELHIKLLSHVNGVIKGTQLPHLLSLDQLGQLDVIDAIAVNTPVLLQQGHDLGAKMQGALTWGLKHYKKVIIVGSDCPAIESEHYEQVRNALDQYEQVFIPASDGGYVLIAATVCQPLIFENMPWGTSEVMEKTRQRLETNNITYGCLDTLWDVDRPEDYKKLISLNTHFKVTSE